MVSRRGKKSQAASKARIKRDALVRRSPVLSIGAKTLWSELSRGWCWTSDQVCFPHQVVIAHALGVSEKSITRWSNELCDADLLIVRRTSRGNIYTLSSKIPIDVCDPDRINNKILARTARHQDDDDEASQIVTSGGSEWDEPTDNLSDGDAPDMHLHQTICPEPSDKLSVESGSHQTICPVPSDNLSDADEAVERKQSKKEEKQKKGSRDAERTPTASSSASKPVPLSAREETQEAIGITQVCSLGVIIEADEEAALEDLDDLIQEDDAPRRKKAHRRSKRGRRANTLVELPGSGLRTASKLPSGPGSVEAEPPPPYVPEDVLELLRGEIEEKFGSKAARGLTGELTAKEKGQIRNTVLRKYEPAVVLSMIRVLVWDWEVARVAFFPYRPERVIPLPENLVQYAKDLAAAITKGLNYSGDKRGAVNTYADVYLKKKGRVEDDNPF